ncbi:MAG: hypothetical protein RSN61_21340 [Chryseobacterium sp.]|uniref:hypothetical protein n=1 Tax=Chryseobacterium sp. TaxID=1871047 RepID=UPI002FCC5AB5
MTTKTNNGDTLMTLIRSRILTDEQLVEHINSILATAHQQGLEIGYDQALFDVGTEQITE